MGKTVGSILTIAAAAAIIYFAPEISAALVSAGLSAGAATAITGALVLASTSAALQSTAGLLGLGPKAPKPDTTEAAQKTTIPPRVAAYGRSKLYGTYILFETSEGYSSGFAEVGAGTAVDVFAVHDGRIDGIERYYLGDDEVTLVGNTVQAGTDGRYKDGRVRIYATLGTTPGTHIPQIQALIPSWDTNHRGDGVVIVAATFEAVKAKDYQDVYPTGLPPATAIVARWQPVFDWRDPTQSVSDPATWKWSENAVLHTAHYKLTREKARKNPGEVVPSGAALQAAWDRYFAPTLSYWTAAADDADEPRMLKAGGTEPRYRSCVAHTLTTPHKEVISSLVACFDGWLAPRADGALIIYSGRYYPPTVNLGPDEILSFTVTDGIDDETDFNEYTVSYISADHQFSTVDTTPWQDTAAIEDAGEIKSTALANQVPSHAQARYLAKRNMVRAREPKRGTVTTNNAGLSARGERYVNLHLEEAGTVFFSGPAEIVRLTRNLLYGITFDWIAADPAIDDWDPATEEGDPAPVTDGVTPTPLSAPTISSATPQYSEDVGAGASGARILLVVSGPIRSDLTWFVRTRETGSTVWTERTYTEVVPGVSTYSLLTEFVAIDASVEVGVSYQTGDGRNSPWSGTETVGTSSAGIAPGPTTDVTAVGGAGQITPTWRNPASLNYSYTRSYYGVSSSFGSATALSPDDAGSPSAVRSATFTGIAPGTYNVWTRAFSASGVGATPTKAPGTVTVT